MKKIIYIIIGLLVVTLAGFAYMKWTEGETGIAKEKEAIKKAAIEKAYKAAEKRIDAHAYIVFKYFSDLKMKTGSLADDLVGWNAKWKLISGGEKGLQKFIDDTIQSRLLDAEKCRNIFLTEAILCSKDFLDIEYKLAEETECFSLTETNTRVKNPDAIPPPETQITDKVGVQIFTDLASLVSGELATILATKLATSGGIIAVGTGSSWATTGIGLVVGILVNQILSWWIDPSKDVENELDKAVIEMGEKFRSLYKQEMKKILDSYKKKWEETI